jgi:hypothetical protein
MLKVSISSETHIDPGSLGANPHVSLFSVTKAGSAVSASDAHKEIRRAAGRFRREQSVRGAAAAMLV